MIKFRFLAIITSFMMMTACGSYSEDSSAVSIQSESEAVTIQGNSNDNPVSDSVSSTDTDITSAEPNEKKKADGMEIVIGEKKYSVTLESNDTVTALTKILPLTLDMSELNGNEKYYYLDTSLPSVPENVGHINEGDIMLYGDSCIVVFYKSFDTSYSYTKIGHIDDTSELADVLGTGSVTVTFCATEIDSVEYTIQDVRNLQDFLLAKPTEESLVGKPYDPNGDKRWDVFDFCLMKRDILSRIEIDSKIITL